MSTDAIGAAEESAPTTELGAAEESAPTTELLTGVVGDRCANCQTPLAGDQRYCVNCGERRGRARFSNETWAARAAPAPAVAAIPPRRQYPRASSAATLVAGVATLLVALGVGVLIGHDSNTSTPAHTPAAQIITVGSGGSSGLPTTAATSGTSKATTPTAHHKIKAKATVVHVTSKTAKAATAAASKVLGSTANKTLAPNVQQQVGGACSGGAGCQNGKFTGNFFPGG